MKIAIIVEGKTEKAFMRYLQTYLKGRLANKMPKIIAHCYDGRIPKENKLKRIVQNLLTGNNAADYVIALTDVYTGTADFRNAADAKAKMREWVGKESRFYPHAAQYDFEAWLLPYWDTIKRLAGHNKKVPAGNPEAVNHDRPPAFYLKEIFEAGSCRDSYIKPRDAGRILRENDLSIAINQCAEFRAFVGRIISLSGGDAGSYSGESL
jgi:hypothetical protein